MGVDAKQQCFVLGRSLEKAVYFAYPEHQRYIEALRNLALLNLSKEENMRWSSFPAIIASLIFGTLLLLAIALWTLSIRSHDDWEYSVLYTDLPEVSGLQSHGRSVYVTLETRHYDGELLSILDGDRSTIVSGLQKPDGLTTSLGALVYTQEFGESPVYEIINGAPHGLFMADGAEGIDSTLNGDLYVIEDRPGGRVLKYERSTGKTSELATGLEAGEGICVMENGVVYFGERDKGTVYKIQNGEISEYLTSLSKPGFLLCDDESQSVWITEDRRNYGRLLHSSAPHQVQVMARGLSSPQAVTINSQGRLLLAEQGRDRVIQFARRDGLPINSAMIVTGTE